MELTTKEKRFVKEPDTALRAVAYMRTATIFQGEPDDDCPQRELCDEIAKALGATVVAYFDDQGQSGWWSTMPKKLEAAITAIVAHNATVLICSDLARVSRNPHTAAQVLQWIHDAGGSVQTADILWDAQWLELQRRAGGRDHADSR